MTDDEEALAIAKGRELERAAVRAWLVSLEVAWPWKNVAKLDAIVQVEAAVHGIAGRIQNGEHLKGTP